MTATKEQKVIGFSSFSDLYLIDQGYTGLLCIGLFRGVWYDGPQPSSKLPISCHQQSVVYSGTCCTQVWYQQCDSIETAEHPCSSHDPATSCHDLPRSGLSKPQAHALHSGISKLFSGFCASPRLIRAIHVPGSHEVRGGNKICSIHPFSAGEKSRRNNQWKKLILPRF